MLITSLANNPSNSKFANEKYGHSVILMVVAAKILNCSDAFSGKLGD